ncbi:MAG: hypothetical protein RI842_04410 [Schleiferiaceae bacterium]|nr:hypothetical protein [Schleiferiaceae bacterium]MDR9441937.1 hypothetical protein [Schleiferiaceae bacterium]
MKARRPYRAWLLKGGLLLLAAVLFLYRWPWESWPALTAPTARPYFWPWFAGFLLLTVLNLSLDATTWLIVQRLVRPLGWRRALLHNLQCYALAFITPFQSGELAGRYLLQPPEHRQKALYLTFWMHAPKLSAKLLVALPLFIWASGQRSFWWPSALLLLIGIGYFYLEPAFRLLQRFRLGKWPLKRFLIAGRPSRREKAILLTINALRFLIFSSQLALMLHLLSPETLQLKLLLSIPVYYLLSAIIPSWTALDFLIKGTLALYFFQWMEAQAATVALAGMAVWFFNVALPAGVGFSLLRPSQWRWKQAGKAEP